MEGGLLVLEVEVGFDLVGVGLSELGLGGILAVDVGGGGCEGSLATAGRERTGRANAMRSSPVKVHGGAELVHASLACLDRDAESGGLDI